MQKVERFGWLDVVRPFAEHLREAVVAVDLETCRIVVFNRAAEELFACPADEAIGKPLDALIPDIACGHWVELARASGGGGRPIAEGESVRVQGRRATGERLSIEICPLTLPSGPSPRTTLFRVSEAPPADVTRERSRYQFELLVRSLTDHSVYLIDPEGRVLTWNEGAARLIGCREAEVLGQSFARFFAPEDLKAGRPQRLLEQARTEGHVRDEVGHVRQDGSRFRVGVTLSAARDPSGRLLGFGTVTEDLTQRLGFEDQLRRSEEKFRSIFERANIGVGLADAQGRFLDVNPALLAVLGYRREEMIGKNYLDFTYPVDRAYCAELVQKLVAGQIAFFSLEKRFQRKDGSAVWVNSIVATIPGADDRPPSILGIIEDITRRKEAEQAQLHVRDALEQRVRERTLELLHANSALESENLARRQVEIELREQQQTLNEAQRLAHMGNWVWDIRNNRVSWSDELYRIYGQTPQAFGATFEAFLAQIVPDDRERVRRTVQDALQTHVPYAIEERIIRPDGEGRILSSTGRVIVDDAGRAVQMQGTCLDITAYKAVEAEIRRLNADLEQRVAERTTQLAAANKELEAFSYSVSHDLRTPLRAIDGFSLALLEDYPDRLDEVGKDYLRRVRAASQRMAGLIDDMLQLSRLTRGELHMARVDLSAIAQDVLRELQRGDPGRDVTAEIAPDLVACGDPRLLRSVLENLLGNAWKFTSKHAHARIAFARTTRDGRAVYFVRDDGAGFDMAHADKLFVPFSRLHASAEFEGTGIGLATVQRIIHRHGGRIWGEGAVEGGATFFFTLEEGS